MLSQLPASAAQCNNCAATAQAANSAASQREGGAKAYKKLIMLCHQLQLTAGLVKRLSFSPRYLLLLHARPPFVDILFCADAV